MEHKLKFYNTLTRKKEEFKPRVAGKVGVYCCGPTVYNYAHIGNLRTYIFEDILGRVLTYNGYKVTEVMNITDVGHLASDADEGEDKLMKAIRREGKEPSVKAMMKLAVTYTAAFKKDVKMLNIQEPDIWCKATDHVPEMIELIKKIEKNGYTYKTSVGLIYDTSRFKNYAELGRLKLEEQKAGARVAIDEERKNPSDFALWVTNQPTHLMQWDSPWGKGFPGWHIECSAMSMKYFGEQFDIHCGGIDHIPVHHTNEIAQSEAATGKHPWVKYWLHGEFLVMEKGKMAKSGESFIILQTLIDKGYDPLVYRYFCLGAHYRQQLSFSWEGLDGAKNAYERLKEKVLELKDKGLKEKPAKEKASTTKNDQGDDFKAAINDDMNMPKALSVMWAVIKDEKMSDKEKLDILLDFDKVLGFGFSDWEREEIKLTSEVKRLLEQRENARKEKKWSLSDELRNKIKESGYEVSDTPEGQKIRKI